eukprot:8111431-Alexandrium_andersonii.AAC.1
MCVAVDVGQSILLAFRASHLVHVRTTGVGAIVVCREQCPPPHPLGYCFAGAAHPTEPPRACAGICTLAQYFKRCPAPSSS